MSKRHWLAHCRFHGFPELLAPPATKQHHTNRFTVHCPIPEIFSNSEQAVAIESAGVVLASSDPRNVIGVIALSHASYRKMIQNLVWATAYNAAAIPLAAGVLAPIGFVLPPAVGAALMSLSTIIVALNAQLLRRLDLAPDTTG